MRKDKFIYRQIRMIPPPNMGEIMDTFEYWFPGKFSIMEVEGGDAGKKILLKYRAEVDNFARDIFHALTRKRL